MEQQGERVTNEAAVRLRDRTLEDGPPFGSMFWNGWETAHDKIDQSLDEALTAERRATVKRIRDAVIAYDRDETTLMAVYEVLDEESAR